MRNRRLIVGAFSISIGALLCGGLLASSSVRKTFWADQTTPEGQTVLPNGWKVTPAGKHIPLPGDMPLAMTLVDGGKELAVVTGGWHDQGVSLIDTSTDEMTAKLGLGDSWAGVALDGTGGLFVSGGPKGIHRVSLEDGLKRGDDLPAPPKGFWISGMASKDGVLYYADVNHGTLNKVEDGQTTSAAEPGHPYGVAISPDGSTLAVSDWGLEQVTLHDPKSLAVSVRLAVGSHPNALAYGPDGRLYVVCSGSNSVSVIKGSRVVETIKTSLDPKDPIGSTPDAVAISPDGKTLYVANADNNDVAVIDVSGPQSAVRGFIPTGWYPSALAASADGKKLFVGTGKGLRFEANGSVSQEGKPTFKYIDSLLAGTVSVVDVPDQGQLASYTAQVERNSPTPVARLAGDDRAVLNGALRHIKHVVYIIRENRTYDQVFGDMGRGNSDPKLVMFGHNVTPNAHEMANDFVLLDNTYCNGEVSEDGHPWCNGAYATDFTERAYVNSYSGRGEPNDDGGIADSPGGFLWDNCRRHGKSFESYGEYADFTSTPNSPPKFTGIKGLEGHASLAWDRFRHGGDYGRDYGKVQVFIDDLHQAEKTGKWFDYMVMSLGEDHTSGLRPGAFSPFASVGSNDLGLGKMVQEVSHSRFWKDTAFFIIEDDAQNGPDHVDAHRTVALVVSPYVKRHAIDSTMYSTSSMVRTIELILGLPPMTQYDQRATPMFNSFTTKPDFTPYTALAAEVDLQAKNPENGALEEQSAKLDWSHYDAADPDKLNAILWAWTKGKTPMPAPVRSGSWAMLR